MKSLKQEVKDFAEMLFEDLVLFSLVGTVSWAAWNHSVATVAGVREIGWVAAFAGSALVYTVAHLLRLAWRG